MSLIIKTKKVQALGHRLCESKVAQKSIPSDKIPGQTSSIHTKNGKTRFLSDQLRFSTSATTYVTKRSPRIPRWMNVYLTDAKERLGQNLSQYKSAPATSLSHELFSEDHDLLILADKALTDYPAFIDWILFTLKLTAQNNPESLPKTHSPSFKFNFETIFETMEPISKEYGFAETLVLDNVPKNLKVDFLSHIASGRLILDKIQAGNAHSSYAHYMQWLYIAHYLFMKTGIKTSGSSLYRKIGSAKLAGTIFKILCDRFSYSDLRASFGFKKAVSFLWNDITKNTLA